MSRCVECEMKQTTIENQAKTIAELSKMARELRTGVVETANVRELLKKNISYNPQDMAYAIHFKIDELEVMTAGPEKISSLIWEHVKELQRRLGVRYD